MNRKLHAVRVGARRGWTETLLSIKSTQDQGFYIFMAVLTLAYMFWNRNSDLSELGVDVSFPQYALPSLLAGLVVFGLVIGPAYSLAMEREDGTLLRAKATPHGLLGYTVGQIVYHSLSLAPMLLVILLPSIIFFDGVMPSDAGGALRIVGFIILGLLATLPIGLIIGALVPNTQKVGSWGMMPIIAMAIISGVFFPIQALWGWIQAIGQVFPMYWIGIGLRSGFLPDDFAAAEIGGTWRTWEAVGVLSAWAIVGLIVAPRVFAVMSRRQSGSAVQEAKDGAIQYIK